LHYRGKKGLSVLLYSIKGFKTAYKEEIPCVPKP